MKKIILFMLAIILMASLVWALTVPTVAPYNTTGNWSHTGNKNISGIVGIGTATPNHPFEVALAIGEIVKFATGGVASGVWGASIGFLSEDAVARIVTNEDAITFHTGATVFTMTEGAERMRIDSATGNVGINKTAPNSTLQIGTPVDATLSYTQLDTLNADTAGPPASGDCDAATEVGRSIVSTRYTATAEYRLWICTQTGAATFAWKYVNLT